MRLYLIKRGPKPKHYRTPYCPVIICTRKDVAMDQAGWSGDGATVWAQDGTPSCGFLLTRWQGLDIDYGHIIRGFTLPDGNHAAFQHAGKEPWQLLNGAVWWSERKMPDWLAEKGVIYPQDAWTQNSVIGSINNCNEDRDRENPKEVKRPEFWPAAVERSEAL